MGSFVLNPLNMVRLGSTRHETFMSNPLTQANTWGVLGWFLLFT